MFNRPIRLWEASALSKEGKTIFLGLVVLALLILLLLVWIVLKLIIVFKRWKEKEICVLIWKRK